MLKKFFCVITACVLGIVGICALGGCGSSNVVETDDYSMVELYTWYFAPEVPNNEIKVKSDKENVVFVCSVEHGQFWSYTDQEYCKEVVLAPDEMTRWDSQNSEVEIKEDFVGIVVKEDSQIIGFAVIKITLEDDLEYSANVLKAVYFNESVSKKYVNSRINKIKNDRDEGTFYSLEEAYENGWLSQYDLKSIAYYYHGYARGENYEENFVAKPKSPRTLSTKTQNKIKKTYLHDLLYLPEGDLERITIYNYYGIYNNCIAVRISDNYNYYDLLIEPEHEVGGVIFYNYSGSIRIWRADDK